MNQTESPPAQRNAYTCELQQLCDHGTLYLQRCAACLAVQYPPRECCGHCLGDELAWEAIDSTATLLTKTALHHSLEPWFSARLPWHVGSLRLDSGPVVWAHLTAGDHVPGARMQVAMQSDISGAWCLIAFDPLRPVERARLEQRLGVGEAVT